MNDDDRTGAFDHLFAGPVREGLGRSAYGAWRSISASEAAPLAFGFPFPEAFPADELLAAAEAVLEAEGGRALQYGGGEDAERLPGVVAERARGRGIDPDDDEVMLTNGAIHALDVVCRTFVEPGDGVFLAAPTFMGALTVFRNYGAEITGVPVDERGLAVEAVAERLRARREAGREPPVLVYAIPDFQNPTGTTLSLDRRRRLLELAEEFDFLVVEDDPYGELRYDGDGVAPLKALDDAGRVARVGTFSKTIAPGVRTGWIVAHGELLDGLELMDAGGSHGFVRGVVGRYCAEGHLEENVAELRRAYRRRRDRMLRCLEAHMPPATRWTEPDGGFFVWVELPEGVDAEAMLPGALEEGVAYLPGSMFFPDDGGTRRLRLSFSRASPDGIERGIRALARRIRSAMAEP